MKHHARRARTPSAPATAKAGWAVPNRTLQGRFASWLPGQRWFAGSAADAAGATITRRVPLAADDTVAGEIVFVHSGSVTRDDTYQVVLGWRTEIPERLQHAVVGAAGDLTCYDGLHDSEITGQLLAAVVTGSAIGTITAVPAPIDVPLDVTAHGLAMTTEQSNTSVVFGNSVIMKFFRLVEPGINPDAEISAKLSNRPYTAEYGGELRIDINAVSSTLALVTRFIPNSADAWSMASASIRDLLAEGDLHADEVGGDFATEAFRLGGVIARMHRDLAAAFGEQPLPESDVTTLLDGIEHDAAALAERLPDMTPLLPGIRSTCAVLSRDLAGARPPGQRIHGDLHLGQVLRTVDGWVVIDFEGEPTVPVAERREPRSPLKDVAGMLRSFDYAARHTLYVSTVNSQRAYRSDEWLAHNRAAFLDGYAAQYGSDPRESPALMTAFELAKAIYEVDYEQRHRPAWVRIPLDAVRVLAAAHS